MTGVESNASTMRFSGSLNIPSTPVSPGGGGYGKRSAEPHGTGVAFHPGLATSFNGPTTYGLPHYGKRSAQAQFPALAALNLPSTPVSSGGGGYGKRSAEPHGTGVAFHPGY